MEHSITAAEFARKYKAGDLSSAQIIDVREPYEWEMVHLEQAVLIPMNTIPERLQDIDMDQPAYILCAHGVRSWHVTHYLLRAGFQQIINVEGGMAEVELHLKPEV